MNVITDIYDSIEPNIRLLGDLFGKPIDEALMTTVMHGPSTNGFRRAKSSVHGTLSIKRTHRLPSSHGIFPAIL